jgi:aspartate carbamoyltransferase catalytic subunit
MSQQTGILNGTRDATLPGQAPRPAERTSAAPGFQRRHLLDLDDFSAAEIHALLGVAASMRGALGGPAKRLSILRGCTLVNLFYENSTRTRVSFELAAKNLGADVVNVTASGSSVAKGESLIDTVRTLQALGAEIVVMRHSQSGAPDLVARHIQGAVVNAGDGWHAHPSQALLDLFTMEERLGSMEGRRVTIIGDILHSRVARSNLWALTAVGAEVVLCGPPTLLPRTLAELAAARPTPDGLPRRVRVEHHIERALEGAEVVMVLRLQRERQASGLLPSLREYTARYGLTPARLGLAAPGALVMHPGPMNEGIEIAPEVAHGAASLIERQVTNGLAVRMGILASLVQARAGQVARHGHAG